MIHWVAFRDGSGQWPIQLGELEASDKRSALAAARQRWPAHVDVTVISAAELALVKEEGTVLFTARSKRRRPARRL